MGVMTPRPSRRRAPLVGVLLAVLALTACTGNDAVDQQPDDRIQGGDAATFRVSMGDRSPVTEVTGELLDGTAFDLADWRGGVVVINFWGTWCVQCRSEAAVLAQVHRDFRQRGVRFLGIDVRDDRAAATAFARSHRLDYPSIFDPSNLLALRFRGVPPSATPTTVVLDREGRVAVRHSGEIRYNVLRAAVQSVLAESA
jgi:thiol-disulfide isomerase/thioredoxin